MSRAAWLWGMAAACAVLLVVVWGRWRMQQTADELAAATAAFERSIDEVTELRRLQRQQAVLPNTSASDADLLNEWQAAIRGVGLPVEEVLADLQPLGQRSMGSDAVPWETIRLNLQGLAVSDLGRIIARWQEQPSPWRITDLQMNHQRDTRSTGPRRGRSSGHGQSSSAGYRCTLTLAAPVFGH